MQDALALSLVLFRDNGKSGDRVGQLEAESGNLIKIRVPLEQCPGIPMLLHGFLAWTMMLRDLRTLESLWNLVLMISWRITPPLQMLRLQLTLWTLIYVTFYSVRVSLELLCELK